MQLSLPARTHPLRAAEPSLRYYQLPSLANALPMAGLGTSKRKNQLRGAAMVVAAGWGEDGSTETLKAQLLDSLYGTERGLKASGEVRAEINELISQLEASNPTPAPNKEIRLLDGSWTLIYTANSELVPLLAFGALPFVGVGEIIQKIDSENRTVENKVQLRSPFSRSSFSATASVEVQSPKRLQVAFQNGRVSTPELLQDVEFPSSATILGQPIDLSSLKEALGPLSASVKDAGTQLAELTRQVPDLKFNIGGKQAQSWLLNTYLDSDLRISRGDGGSIFVLTKSS